MPTPSSQRLFLLTGPTAVGKTDLSLRLAKDLDAEILSCDSLLFYKGMDIGTAKPSPEEQAQVPHYGIDICEPHQSFNVVEFRDYALKVAQKIYERKKNILVVGGSGFYFQSFLQPIADKVDVPLSIKEKVEKLYQDEGLSSVLERLQALHPEGLGSLDIQNPRRVLPALERCLASGKTLQQLRQEFNALPDPWESWKKQIIVLERSREDLHKRAKVRVDHMLTKGLIDEVHTLLTKKILENPSAAHAIGYREVIQFINSKSSDLDSLAKEITTNTRKLIRKQNTWFRNQLPAHHTINMENYSETSYQSLLHSLDHE